MFKLKSKYIKLEPGDRMHGCPIPIIGLTGGIATGKSTVSNMAKEIGLPVIDADMLVKKIYANKETIAFISENYPQAVHQGEIAFQSLRELFFNDKKIKQTIESYIYERLPDAFYEDMKPYQAEEFIIYDVPLLFERKLDKVIDSSVCVYAPKTEQINRLIQRDQISPELAEKILKSQMSIETKRKRADYVIDNSGPPPELNAKFQVWLNEFFELT